MTWVALLGVVFGCGMGASKETISGPAPSPKVELVFLGDVLVGGEMAKHTQGVTAPWAFQHLQPLWASAHSVWANLEGPLMIEAHPEEGSKSAYYSMSDAVARGLSEVGVRGVLHANNHTLDRGIEGLLETRTHLMGQGIVTLGTGSQRAEAWTPHRIETPYGEVAVFGMTEAIRPHAATEDRAGVARFDRETMAEAVAGVRRDGVDHVVAFIHWGRDFMAVDKEMRWAAGIMSLSGIDLVVGVGPQIPLPVESVRGTPVVWSIGNSASGAPPGFTDSRPGYGVVLSAVLGENGFEELRAHCIVTDLEREGAPPRPCSDSVSRQVLSAQRWAVDEQGVGHMTWPAPWVDPSKRDDANP
jgi:poly-gamma-glutamate capsule biosynthesis protein CapA/YwtB (metallophosphatase superfamily)